MVVHGSHFYFMILDKIQINQGKIKFLFLTEHFNLSKWEQSKDIFMYYLQTDKEISFPCDN